MTPERVTLVGHDASRTGAPILLLSLLRWVDRNAEADLRLVLRRGGPLLDDYRSVAPTTLLDDAALRIGSRVTQGWRAVRRRPSASSSPVERVLLHRRSRPAADAEVVVANTLASLATAVAIAPPTARLVCHVHELDHVAERVLSVASDARTAQLDRVDHFVATGGAVERMLVSRWGVEPARVSTVDAFIDAPSPDEGAVAFSRERLAGQGRAIVLSVGATSRRKGPDRFVDLMAMLADHPHRPVGVWLGGDPFDVVGSELRSDIGRAAIADSMVLLAASDDPAPVVAAAHVVVSTAREDPFPLGVLEAGALGVPVVTFDNGAIGALLRACGNGRSVVPLGDTLALRDAVARLLDDREAAAEEGARLCRHVRSTHLVEHLAPRLWRALVGPGALVTVSPPDDSPS